ncbi:MAG: lipopolysaccharide biosynthesis protein [Bacteroidales bacterium]|nr:lipopolysaccharide biosynthesis protein [Bacteroidales bacterium]
MGTSVKDSFFKGIFWNATGKISHQGISFVVSIILSRILVPAEFGMIAMLTIFTEIAKCFIDSGLGAALIQKKDCTSKDFSTVFYFNITVSFIFYLILFFTAPFIAKFYELPELTNITRLIALVFLINSFGTIQSTILSKSLNFKSLNIVAVIAVTVSAIVAIIMSLNGFGVYSIVGQHISYALVSNLLYWILSDWRPSFVFSKKSFRELFGFGYKLLFSAILNQIFTHLDSLLIGKIFSAKSLGLYTRAKTTKDLPINSTTGIVQSILLPIFSKINNDEQLAAVGLKIYRMFFYIISPLMVGLIITAEPFIITLFSDKWLPSAPWMQIICISGITYPLSVTLCHLILAKGKSGTFLKLEIIKKTLTLLAMIIGLYFGINEFLWCTVIASYIGLYLNLIYAANALKTIKKTKFITALLPALAISIIMGICVFGINYLQIGTPWIKLIVMTFIGMLIYVLLSKLFNLWEYGYIKQFIIDKFKEYKEYKAKKI